MPAVKSKKGGRPPIGDKARQFVIAFRVDLVGHNRLERLGRKQGLTPGALAAKVIDRWLERQVAREPAPFTKAH